MGIRDDDPTLKVPSPKRPKSVPRPISTEQLMETLKYANRKRTRMMILLAAFAGLRVHEIAKIRGEDIDRYGATLTVNGKGGKTAVLPLHDVLLTECQEWPTFGYWFPNYEKDGGPVIPKAVGAAIQRTMERAKIHGTAHQLRHWYATTLLESGVDVRIVQELLRHESLATTQIYTKVSDKQRRLGMNSLQVADLPNAKMNSVHHA
ncbi:integrase [Arthrobacter sp. MYb227]|nr:integrase [Arthrobacter sp. MYb227]